MTDSRPGSRGPGGDPLTASLEVDVDVGDEEYRRASRDSMFLLASLRIETKEGEHSIKVRNLSSTGLMAEGAVHVRPGSIVAIKIRNIGWIGGSVTWVVDNRFGVMLDNEIDPIKARSTV